MSDLVTIEFEANAPELTIDAIEKKCADINVNAGKISLDLLDLWEAKAHWTLYGPGATWSDFAVKMLDGRFANERGLMRALSAAKVVREITGAGISKTAALAMPQSHLLALSTPKAAGVEPKAKVAILNELKAAAASEGATVGPVTAVLIEKKVAGLMPPKAAKEPNPATDKNVSRAPKTDVPAETPFDKAVAEAQTTEPSATSPVAVEVESTPDTDSSEYSDAFVPDEPSGDPAPFDKSQYVCSDGMEVTDAFRQGNLIVLCIGVLIGGEFQDFTVKIEAAAIEGL